jgi:hypothetical protein
MNKQTILLMLDLAYEIQIRYLIKWLALIYF